MKRLTFLWNNYKKQMDRYCVALKENKKVAARIHKESANKILEEYFEALEKEVIE